MEADFRKWLIRVLAEDNWYAQSTEVMFGLGTPDVYAIKDGAVYVSVPDDAEFGNYVILSHDTGKLTSVYAHLQKIIVEQYQTVKKGEIIGYVGHTGMATGDHLHFEIRQGGKPEDPRQKLRF